MFFLMASLVPTIINYENRTKKAQKRHFWSLDLKIMPGLNCYWESQKIVLVDLKQVCLLPEKNLEQP